MSNSADNFAKNDSSQKQHRTRAAYEKPMLTVYGELRDLTAGGIKAKHEDNSSGASTRA